MSQITKPTAKKPNPPSSSTLQKTVRKTTKSPSAGVARASSSTSSSSSSSTSAVPNEPDEVCQQMMKEIIIKMLAKKGGPALDDITNNRDQTKLAEIRVTRYRWFSQLILGIKAAKEAPERVSFVWTLRDFVRSKVKQEEEWKELWVCFFFEKGVIVIFFFLTKRKGERERGKS
jgi:hypothetical protein